MYDLPGLEAANNALWLAVASRLTANGIHNVPPNLSRTIPATELWHHPRLLLAQSCGYPLVTSLRDAVKVVATPQYHAPGCQGSSYRSAIVVAATNSAATLADLRGTRSAQMPGAAGGAQRAQWVCTGPIVYKGHEALARDIDNLKAALAPVGYEDAFMPAVSPAQLAGWNKNEFYKTDEEFGLALADALREEYRAIVDAGLVLQIDAPQLASHYTTHPELDIAQCRNWANVTVELLNHALAGIPAERVRYHTCYGINMGPRVHDLELKHIVDIMLRVNAGAYSFEAGNPRHEHEWRVWEESKLPDGKLLIPGVITHGSNFVEHPEAIAQRIGRFAQVVGRENVIAGADCGFASFSTTCEVHPTVVWSKLASLAEGARLATKELWGRA